MKQKLAVGSDLSGRIRPKRLNLRVELYNGASWILLALAWAPLGQGGLPQQCNNHMACGTGPGPGTTRFCNTVPFSQAAAGFCDQCWKCCLFPQRFNFTSSVNAKGAVLTGGCSLRCGCNVGALCSSNNECAQGLFCTRRPFNAPICRPCTNCTTDSVALSSQGCSPKCPGGAVDVLLNLDANNETSHDAALLDAAVFLSFALEPWRDPGSDPTQVKAGELIDFLSNETALQKAINSTLSYAPMYVMEAMATIYQFAQMPYNSTLSLKVIAPRLVQSSRTFLCPKLNTSLPASALPRLSGPSCPCNYTQNAATFRCPSGYRCSRLGYLGLSTDVLSEPTWGQMLGICIPCVAGQHCKEGSYITLANELTVPTLDLDCPAGYFCITSSEMTVCPAGYFCPSRSRSPITCNYQNLLKEFDPLTTIVRDLDIVTRLRDDGEPVRGNYCPQGSRKPSLVCPAGWFCPNASVQIICPKGHYCKLQSIFPVKCPPLVKCPEGTGAPNGRALAGAVFAVIMVFVLMILVAIQGVFHFCGVRSKGVQAEAQARVDASSQGQQAAEVGAQAMAEAGAQSGAQAATYEAPHVHVNMSASDKVGQNRVSIRFTNVHVEDRLYGTSGVFEAAQVNVVMGPSGCGKTTLIELLSGRLSSVYSAYDVMEASEEDGTAASSGRQNSSKARKRINLTSNFFRRKLGFVPQDDILHPDLTVRENIEYSARLNLARSATNDYIQQNVEKTLKMLEMQQKQDSRTGSVERKFLSGGQRKRVSIGVEIVGNRPVMFMDEPTSGLDAASSSGICNLMSTLAKDYGINIIAVIHQPRCRSFLEQFDNVLLLGLGGKFVFQGTPQHCVKCFQTRFPDCFEQESPPDAILDIVGQLQFETGGDENEPPTLWMKEDVIRSRRSGFASNRLTPAPSHMTASDAATDGALLSAHTSTTVRWGLLSERPSVAEMVQTESGPKAMHNNGMADTRATVSPQGLGNAPSCLQSSFTRCVSRSDVLSAKRKVSREIELIRTCKQVPAGTQQQKTLRGQADVPKSWFTCLVDPDSFLQVFWIIHRNVVMANRVFWPNTVLDVLYLQTAAFIVGAIQGSDWNLSDVPSNFVMAFLVLSVLSSITHLRTFSAFRTVQRYERKAGISVTATFVASNLTDLLWIFVSPAVFFVIYYFTTIPRVPFSYLYTVGFLVCWWSSGLSYAVSFSRVPPQHHTIVMVAINLILGAFLHGMSPTIRSSRGGIMEGVLGLSFNRWAMEAATIQEFKEYIDNKGNEIIVIFHRIGLCKMDRYMIDDGDDVLSIEEALAFMNLQRNLGRESCDEYSWKANVILFGMGVGMRLLAYVQMKLLGLIVREVAKILRSCWKGVSKSMKKCARPAADANNSDADHTARLEDANNFDAGSRMGANKIHAVVAMQVDSVQATSAIANGRTVRS